LENKHAFASGTGDEVTGAVEGELVGRRVATGVGATENKNVCISICKIYNMPLHTNTITNTWTRKRER
jgi:hypothetical protein